MREELTLLGGIGLGSALMSMLDPDRGNRRCALVRDKLVSAPGVEECGRRERRKLRHCTFRPEL
jgi:hypothetical protein